MVRLGEAGSKELYPVSQYYSSTLVTYIRTVLQVIPATMFSLLEQVMQMQAKLNELPTRLEKDKLKEFSQLDQRFQIAKLTHQVSVLSTGILAMRTTLVGVVQVDPKKLLEEGLRRELVTRVTTALHNVLTFNPKSKDRVGDLTSRLSAIGRAMEGFRSSFEYIQDYINIPGLRLWQEEISRIVNHAVEKEAAGFLKGSGESYSQYQSVAVPIPEFPPDQGESELLAALVPLAQWVGLDNPGQQVYCPSSRRPPALLPLLLSLLVVQNLLKAAPSPATHFLIGKKPGEMDGWLLLSGLATFLQQLHPQVGKQLVEKLTQARDSFTLASDHQEAHHMGQFLQLLQMSANGK